MQNIVEIGHEEALISVQTIVEELKRRGKAAVIAVADRHGELVALLRTNGAPYPSATIATNKAFTSARERKLSGDIGRSLRSDGWDIAFMGDPRFTGWDGGVPVKIGGEVVGAIAVSGLTGEEDTELAQLGAQRIEAEHAGTKS
jgi:glc operon protein GlcG